jgi:hypothetical protein
MLQHASDVFDKFPAAGYDERLLGANGVVRFNVRDQGSWRVEINDGYFKWGEGRGQDTLVIDVDERELLRVVERQAHFITAVMRGDILVSGDLSLLLTLHAFLGGPRRYVKTTAEESRP